MTRNHLGILVSMVEAHIKANENTLSMELFIVRLDGGGSGNTVAGCLARRETLREVKRLARGMATCLDPETSEEDAMQILRRAREEVRKGEVQP